MLSINTYYLWTANHYGKKKQPTKQIIKKKNTHFTLNSTEDSFSKNTEDSRKQNVSSKKSNYNFKMCPAALFFYRVAFSFTEPAWTK